MKKLFLKIPDWLKPAGMAITILLGILAGIGIFTFFYARGYSYLTDNPTACINCHVMREEYNSWKASAHRSQTCNDCHVPHSLVPKYLIKARNGFAHSYAFTFTKVQVIQAKPVSQKVVQANCQRCHQPVTGHLNMEERYCFDCHAETRHTH
jgi:cytochrome c nitrite reductase small subunit